MKKTLKTLLLALLVVCTVCVLTVMVGAEGETPATEGYVRLYESDKTTAAVHENDTNYLKWKVESDGTDNVLTIFLESKEGATKSETTLTFNTAPGWDNDYWNDTKIPWYHHLSSVTKVVIEAPITAINQDYAFDMLKNVHTFVIPSDKVIAISGNMMFANMNALTKFGPEGTADNTLDFRNINGKSGQGFESSCQGKTVTILCSYTGDFLPSKDKVFADTTTLTIKALEGSPAYTTAVEVAELAITKVWNEKKQEYEDRSPFANSVTVEPYDTTGLVVEGVTSDGDAKWALDLGTKTLTVEKAGDGRKEFRVHDSAWKSFATTFKNMIETVKIDTVSKFTLNGATAGLFPEGSDTVKTIILEKGQRIANYWAAANYAFFQNLPALTTIDFVADINDIRGVEYGVVDLTGWGVNDQDAVATGLKNAFNGDSSITKVILPDNALITTVHESTFTGCKSLTSVVIGENITTIENGAFANWINSTEGYANLTVTFTEVTDAANALKTLEDGKLTVIVLTADTTGLEKGITFDAWKVRISGYNGLRGVFYFDDTVTAANKDNGWTLVEYGALLTTTAKKEAMGAVVYYDGTSSSVDGHVKYWPIFKDGKVSGKTLSNPVDVQKENATYFAVTIKEYENNYTTDVYMAGYEIWKNTEGEIVIKYTDYANDTYKNTSIYDVSMGMYMAGVMNSEIDADDIVWDTLVAGGALTLNAGTDYEKTDDRIEGDDKTVKVFDGEGVKAVGDTFQFVNVPGVAVTRNDTSISFSANNLRISIFAHPEKADKYVLIYGAKDGTTAAVTGLSNPWGGNLKVSQQFSNAWIGSGYTTIKTALPNPITTTNISANVDYIVLDKGVTSTTGNGFGDLQATTTLVYSEDFVKITNSGFAGFNNLKTMFKAGTTPVVGTFDLHEIPTFEDGWIFDGCRAVEKIWLPDTITKVGSEMFKNNASLTSVWCGETGTATPETADFSNTSVTTTASNAFTGATKITTVVTAAQMESQSGYSMIIVK